MRRLELNSLNQTLGILITFQAKSYIELCQKDQIVNKIMSSSSDNISNNVFFTEGTVGMGKTHIYNTRGNNKRVSASARTDTTTDLLAG